MEGGRGFSYSSSFFLWVDLYIATAWTGCAEGVVHGLPRVSRHLSLRVFFSSSSSFGFFHSVFILSFSKGMKTKKTKTTQVKGIRNCVYSFCNLDARRRAQKGGVGG